MGCQAVPAAEPADVDLGDLDDCLGGEWMELVEQQNADDALEEEASRVGALGSLASVGSGADAAALASGPYYAGNSRTTQWRKTSALRPPMESTGERQSTMLDFFPQNGPIQFL